jgi:hypothetical protein
MNMSYLELAKRSRQNAKSADAGEPASERPDGPGAAPTLSDANSIWQAALDLVEGDPAFPPEVMEGLRAANACWLIGDVVRQLAVEDGDAHSADAEAGLDPLDDEQNPRAEDA